MGCDVVRYSGACDLVEIVCVTPIEPDARKFLETEMEKFFFGGGSAVPDEFVNPES